MSEKASQLRIGIFVVVGVAILFGALFLFGIRSAFEPTYTLETYVSDNVDGLSVGSVVKLRGVEIARGTLNPGQFLAMDPGTAEGDVPGIETTEPAFGLPARWIAPAHKERAELLGYTVVDAESVLATHLTELVKRFAPDLLSRQDTQNLLENLRGEYPALVEELVPTTLTVGEVQEVFQRILAVLPR